MSTFTLNENQKFRPQGGMTTPYVRTLVWDFDGKGDEDDDGVVFPTLQAALTYAGARATNTDRYLVQVTGQGNNVETNLNVPLYVSLEGSGSPNCRFTGGTVTIQNGRNRINGVSITLTSTDAVGLRVVNDTAGGRVLIGPDVAISCDKNWNGTTAAIEITGTAATIMYIRGGTYLYAENDDAGASAACAGVVMDTGVTAACEIVAGVHVKTSASGGGKQVGLWRKTSSGGYFHSTCDFAPAYAGPTYQFINEGTDRNIGYVFMPSKQSGPPYTRTFQRTDAHSTADLAFMEMVLGRTEVRGRLIAKGTWDYPFTLGNVHLWHTAAGAMSFKSTVDGMPSSDVDGWSFQMVSTKRIITAVALVASTDVALPDLTLAVKAGQSWALDYMIPVQVTGGTAGLKPQLAAPAGTTGWVQNLGTTSSFGSSINTGVTTSVTAVGALAYITASFTGWIQVRGAVTITTDGNLSIVLVTGASAAGSVLANGFLRATRLG